MRHYNLYVHCCRSWDSGPWLLCAFYICCKTHLLHALQAIICGMAIKLHSPIVRLLYEKYEHTQEHLDSTHEYVMVSLWLFLQWYTVRSNLLSKYAMDRFVQAHQDEETTQFLKSCFDKSDWFFTQLYHTISRSILTWFMTLTSCNG